MLCLMWPTVRTLHIIPYSCFLTLTSCGYKVYMALCYPGRRGQRSGLFPNLDLMSLSMILVGITSSVFHGTLLLNAQLADELSMLVLATAILHRLYIVGLNPLIGKLFTVLLLSSTLCLATAYIKSGDVMYHVTIFGAQLTCIWPRTLYLIFSLERTERRARHLRQFAKAVIALVVGYALWQIDLEFCEALRSVRLALGIPLSFLLEFHGWWHVLTALGAIEYIKLIRELCP